MIKTLRTTFLPFLLKMGQAAILHGPLSHANGQPNPQSPFLQSTALPCTMLFPHAVTMQSEGRICTFEILKYHVLVDL